MEIVESKNFKGETLYDLYDDNNKYIMERIVVEGTASGEYFNGIVVAVRGHAFKIVSGMTSRVIEYNDLQSLNRIGTAF